ncbi:hypothetical protein Vadar_026468 [Vaccinium darrowii]|uniref:Uncharacterized protein n=1 Tax=Vaccinium darrowii TaxID=229202 RepID=A0ACB7XU33_9ERIC|nr:hypothetical protein Vadar_026468 [Vaccinium darrowii]
MSKPRRLEGKVAIITGAARGIGEAAAKVFAENGAFVVVADIQEELGLKVVASIIAGEGGGGPDDHDLNHMMKAIYKKCDVTVEKQVEETVVFAIEKYGALDIMYSNVGIMVPVGSILDMDMDMEKGFDRTMARPHSEGWVPHAYTASKHGLVGLVRSAAGELGKDGIRVNCVSPSGVATPMATENNLDPSKIEALNCSMANLKGIVLKPKHVAEAALFLASDESIFVSGHNLAFDGGATVVDNSLAMMRQRKQ